MASLGGGPGYELLALSWYLRQLAIKRGVRPPRLDLVSLDLHPSSQAPHASAHHGALALPHR